MSTDDQLREFEDRIGYTFQSRDIFRRALTHKSYSHEAKQENVLHNETFEFLGDSVLGFVIGDLLFRRFPGMDEGALRRRSSTHARSAKRRNSARLTDRVGAGVRRRRVRARHRAENLERPSVVA